MNRTASLTTKNNWAQNVNSTNYIPNKEIVPRIYKKPLQLNNKKKPKLKVGKGSEQFSKDDVQGVSKHMKRCLTSSDLKEM